MASGETTVGGIVGFLRMDDAEFNRTIDRAIARLEALQHHDATIDIRGDTHRLDERLDELNNRLRETDQQNDRVGQSSGRASRGMGALATSIITLGPALIPLAAGATGLAAGLGAMGTAGAAALLAIKKEMASGTDLGNEYAHAIAGVHTELLNLGHTAAAGLLGPLNTTIAGLMDRWPVLNREVGEFASLAGQTAGAVLNGLVGAFVTLEPLMLRVGMYVLSLSERFASLMSGSGMRGFGDYVSSVFPSVMASVEAIVSAVARLVQAFAPIGSVVLSAITGVAQAINAIPVDVLTAAGVAALSLFAAFKAWAVIKSAAMALSRMADATGTLGPRMAAAAASTTVMLGVVGGVAAVLSVVTFAWMKHQASVQASKQAVDSLTDALIRSNGVVDDTIIHDRAIEISKGKVADAARQAGVDLGDLTLASLGNADAQDRVSAALATHAGQLYTYQAAGKSAVRVESDMGKAVHSVTDFLSGSNKELTAAQQARSDFASATQSATSATESQNIATQALAGTMGISVPTLLAAEAAQQKNADSAAQATLQMQLENDAAGLLKGTLDALNGKTLDVATAQTNSASASLRAIQALKDHTKGQNDFGKSLSLTTEKGVAARQALEAKARADQQAAEAVAKATGSTKAGTKSLADNKAALEATLKKQGLLTDKVQAYIDKIYQVPKKVPPTQLEIDKKQADAQLNALARHLSVVTQPRTVTVTTQLVTVGSGPFSGKKVPTSATGGTVGGGSGPTADDQLTWLSTGEEVVNAKAAAKWRPLLKAINAGKFAAGGTVGGGAGWAGLDSSLISRLGKDLGAQVVQAFADGMNGGKGAVKSVAEQIRTIVSDNAKKAGDVLKSLLDAQASYAKQIGGSFLSTGSLTDATARGKSFTVGPDGTMTENTPSPFADQLTSAIGQTKGFESTIEQLVKLGARTDVLQQFLDKGPEAADAAAALAAMGRSGVSDVNRLQGQLVSATSSLGSFGASAVYGPRVSAARVSVQDAKVVQTAMTNALAPQLTEARKVTAELRRVNVQLERQAQNLVNALERAGSGAQGAARNRPAR